MLVKFCRSHAYGIPIFENICFCRLQLRQYRYDGNARKYSYLSLARGIEFPQPIQINRKALIAQCLAKYQYGRLHSRFSIWDGLSPIWGIPAQSDQEGTACRAKGSWKAGPGDPFSRPCPHTYARFQNTAIHQRGASQRKKTARWGVRLGSRPTIA